MFTKNIFLGTCLLSGLIFAGNQNDQVIGGITKTHVKDFAFGFALGLTHGTINNVADPKMQDNLGALHVGSYLAATKVDATYNNNSNEINRATLWGRGIGQCLGESIDFQNRDVKPKISLNITLFFAMLSLVLSDKK